VFRTHMENLRVAQDFLQGHLPTQMQKKMDLTALKLCDGSFVDQHLQESLTDMLYSVPYQGTEILIYILVEHVRHEVVQ
ncbi:MAG TPA: Rpn family recombination-promoting nuclease/putative transposase, partial [Chlamydiales bacterium]|nr:Rpn family recombination-promoting nuclease/putative transposase [Chlamydiales bacterium]